MAREFHGESPKQAARRAKLLSEGEKTDTGLACGICQGNIVVRHLMYFPEDPFRMDGDDQRLIHNWSVSTFCDSCGAVFEISVIKQRLLKLKKQFPGEPDFKNEEDTVSFEFPPEAQSALKKLVKKLERESGTMP